MKILLIAFAALCFSATPAHAQRTYNQAELDALLAPIALHPDPLLSQILIAATYPEELAEAARWSRANPHLKGDDAARAVQGQPWDPAVKSLVAFPELLARMVESPQWLRDLGEAFLLQQAQVMDTVQGLRRRAQAVGHLASTEHSALYQQGGAIVIQPRAQVVYVRYYDPYVVYGPWWWPHYRPVFWHPWAPRPVFVAHGFFYSTPDWHHRHVRVAQGRWQQQRRFVPAPAVRLPVRVPEAQRQPIVQSAPRVQSAPLAGGAWRKPMPAANGFSEKRKEIREQRSEQRQEHRRESNPEHRRRRD